MRSDNISLFKQKIYSHTHTEKHPPIEPIKSPEACAAAAAADAAVSGSSQPLPVAVR